MDIEEYFSQPNTPAKDSPIGVLIVRVLEKFPALTFEQARIKAHDLLATAAKARVYRLPRVRSAAEMAAEAQRLKMLPRASLRQAA